MNKKHPLSHLLPVLFGFFVMGFCDVVGVATSYVQQHFSLSESLAGLIPSMVFLWFLLLAVPVAFWMNRIGRRRMVIAGNVVTIVGMLVPLADYSFAACLVAFALLGIGNTILQVSLNPLLTNVVDSRALSSSLTAGQVIKAVSSFSGPFIAAFAASKLGNWVWMFPIFAGISLVSALWLMATPIDEGPAERTSSAGELLAVLRDRKITMLFLGIVAIVGIDVGLNTLAPKLLIERCDMPLEQAGYGSSVYFFCRVVGAFVGSLLLTRLSDRRYYILHMLLGARRALCTLLRRQPLCRAGRSGRGGIRLLEHLRGDLLAGAQAPARARQRNLGPDDHGRLRRCRRAAPDGCRHRRRGLAGRFAGRADALRALSAGLCSDDPFRKNRQPCISTITARS